MNIRFLLSLSLLLLFTSPLFSQYQKLTEFSENRGEYINQLKEFMTSSKRKTLEETFELYQTKFQSFSEDEFKSIREVSNLMLTQKMSASPYFSDYLKCLSVVKNSEEGTEKFEEWQTVLNRMLGDIKNRKLNPFKKFLSFSISFFEKGALRYSKSGINWLVESEDYKIIYEEGITAIKYEDLNLIATRKKDSITIQNTSGIFYPSKLIWEGKGGKVSWDRFEELKDVYAELGEYKIEVKKSLYDVKNVKFYHPEFFPNGPVEGSFGDKVSAKNRATGGSYPRFESKDSILSISNIGAGIQYTGGFRFKGKTVYGYGSKDHKAKIILFKDNTSPIFKAASELFVIRKDEQIAGERVEAVMFFDKDSIYHPSLNFKFNIADQIIKVNRGKRGSDRNPFYNSYNKMNIETDRIDWFVQQDSMVIGSVLPGGIGKGNKQVSFESLEYFDEGDYRRIQSIADYNPIAVLKSISEREATRILDANFLAKKMNPRFNVSSIQSLLYDLVAKGFVNYDSDKQLVEVKDKVIHYADASREKVDYDVLKIVSETKKSNATFNLKTKETTTNGVKNIEFSARQKVALKPLSEQIVLRKNRDMDFDGKLFAGFGILQGKDFKFSYDRFQIQMDSVRYFDLFLPTGEKDKNDQPVALSIASRIEHTSGILLIDAPSNKSGKEGIPMFPSFESKGSSYVYYHRDSTQNFAYPRDSFYFMLDEFSFISLDSFAKEDVRFDGKLVSANIFPDIKETLLIQDEDNSLGFVTQTPNNGFPSYQGKGNYKGETSLSNKGFLGKGNLSYLGASLDSEDIIFKPNQLTCSAEAFHLDEDRTSAIQVPQADGFDVNIDWRPYKDSMYVKTKEKPFELFKANLHQLKGTLILTPGGLKGVGNFDWDKGQIYSKQFSFGAFSLDADTSNLKINTLETDAVAFDTKDVSSDVDFDKMIGRFKSNGEHGETKMPYNQYTTTLNEFEWDMNAETVTFLAEENKYGNFTSIHSDQDSLIFDGQTAFYNLKTNQLKIGGVPKIHSADAYIYPDSGSVEIKPGGVMTTLVNAKIIADITNKYHVINRATVNIKGRKEYRASGFYEYNIGNKKQEIKFANIIGTRVGKGKRRDKATLTQATGEVKEADKFYIDHKTEFRGQISLKANSQNLNFDGFAKLDAKKLIGADWFSISSEADKNNMIIQFNEPKNYNGDPIRNGIFLSKERAIAYPRVMMPTYFRKDRTLIDTRGVFKYEEKNDRFFFGDSLKVTTGIDRGNLLIYDNRDASVKAEGTFNIGSGLENVKVTAAGRMNASFNPEKNNKVTAELMAGINISIPDKLLKLMITDIKSSTFDANPIDYTADKDGFYNKTLSEFILDDKALKKMKDNIAQGGFKLPKKNNNFTFFFSKMPMIWDADYQSFVSSKNRVGLASIAGEPINSNLSCYVEFKMPSNEDDRVYIYIKSPSEYYYFFGYKQGVLNIGSNNQKFNDELASMKKKELTIKSPDGNTFEILPVDTGTAERFVRRAQAVKR